MTEQFNVRLTLIRVVLGADLDRSTIVNNNIMRAKMNVSLTIEDQLATIDNEDSQEWR